MSKSAKEIRSQCILKIELGDEVLTSWSNSTWLPVIGVISKQLRPSLSRVLVGVQGEFAAYSQPFDPKSFNVCWNVSYTGQFTRYIDVHLPSISSIRKLGSRS